MSNGTIIRGPNSVNVKVTASGELVVGPLHYSDTKFNTLDVAGTASNFYGPEPKKQFVITAILAFADKDVNDTTDTIITIYEANSPTSATADKVLLQFGMGKLTVISATPLSILVNAGVFINAKTGDDDIHLNIMGFYIDELSK